jgi:hypothetical protein
MDSPKERTYLRAHGRGDTMRMIRATLLAAAAATHLLLVPPAAMAAGGAAPPSPDCGSGRAWWPPLEACVTLPVLKKKVEPHYPDAIPGLRYGAVLYVKVSATGTVGDVQVLKAPPEGEPTEEGETALAALVEAVRQWRFAPGRDPAGNPVAMSVTLKVHLLLDEEEE